MQTFSTTFLITEVQAPPRIQIVYWILIVVADREDFFGEIEVMVPLVGAYPVLKIAYKTSGLSGITRPGAEVG
mgnify:CR=1 FL=1